MQKVFTLCCHITSKKWLSEQSLMNEHSTNRRQDRAVDIFRATSEEFLRQTIDRDAMLRDAVTQIHKILKVESCSVFLVKDGSPTTLYLAAEKRDKRDVKGAGSQSPLEIQIVSEKQGGLTGHIAYRGELFCASGKELQSNIYIKGEKPKHLKSDECLSLLGIPLKDDSGNLLGLLKVENKKGTIDKDPAFTEVEKSNAIDIARKLEFALVRLNGAIEELKRLKYSRAIKDIVLNYELSMSSHEAIDKRLFVLKKSDQRWNCEFCVWIDGTQDIGCCIPHLRVWVLQGQNHSRRGIARHRANLQKLLQSVAPLRSVRIAQLLDQRLNVRLSDA